MIHIPPYIIYAIEVALAALITAISIPKIIVLAKRKRLFDQPDNDRKIHKKVIPNLGGIGIFFSTLIVASIFIHPQIDTTNPTLSTPALFPINHWFPLMVSASLILFIIGIKDDIITLTPAKKFAAQIVASIGMVLFADVRLQSLQGMFGIYELPYWLSVSFSIVGCIFVTNAFNLIDGIDGLAGSISALCALSFGIFLGLEGNYNAACLSFALFGALLGFLRHNIAPAKIFMGDSGSLFSGFTISILGIQFINSFSENTSLSSFIHGSQGALLLALAILFIPVFDSFRVFITRIAKGQHPFKADKIHLHHYLLDLGFSHTRTVTTLITANFLIITVSLLVQDYNPNIGIATILLLTFGLFAILYFMRRNLLQKIDVGSSVKNIKEQQNTAQLFISADNNGVRVNTQSTVADIEQQTAVHSR